MELYTVFDFIGVPLLALLFVFLFVMETKQELRYRRISRKKRIFRNVGVAFVAFFVMRLALIPALVAAGTLATQLDMGILNWLKLQNWVKFTIGFLLLDYSNYGWHYLNHKFPFLWRFHNIHHIDLDVDVTTAIRFHYAEVLISAFVRGLAVFLIGASPFLVLIYEIAYEAANNFHHSNWRLPYKFEKLLNKLFVTPRMHGIHHSIVKEETDSNYSIIFSFWDRVHRTMRVNIPQGKINIGVPSYRGFIEQNIFNLFKLPFKKQRPWELPGGEVPKRDKNELVGDKHNLAK